MKSSLTLSTKKDDLSAYSQAKREKIVKAALETFLQYGYKGTSMNRVAEKAGVIKQTIYSHFSDKEGLFTAIVQSVTLEHLKAQFGESIDSDQSPEKVLKKIAQIFSERQKDKSYLALMRTIIGESKRFPELARLYVSTVIKPAMKILCDYFNKHPELKISDPEAIARIYCGTLVSSILMQEILYGKDVLPFKMERLSDNLIDLILNRRDK